MKKIRCILFFLVLLLAALPAAAQFSYKLGVTGGVLLKETKDMKTWATSKQGWYAGPIVEIGLPLGLKVDGSVQYQHRELCVNDWAQLDMEYLSIPLNLKLNFGLPKVLAVYVAGGPQFDNRLKKKENEFWTEQQFMNPEKKSRLSWNVGGGLRVFNHFQIGVAYNFATNEDDANTWRMNATIFF